MIVKLTLVQGAGLMGCVAGLAAHVECGVTAAFLRYLRALRVAGQAEVVVLGGAGNGFAQLVLVFRSVRIVAGQAVADRGLVRSEEHTSELQSRGHLVCRLLLDKKKERGE